VSKSEIPVPLDQLCVYFRVNPQHMSYIQRHEMLYVYQKLSEWLGDPDVQRIIAEADALRITLRIRGRRRSLYYVFQYCQQKAMRESGRYVTNTAKLPIAHQLNQHY
jgi:hypothetical protein